MTISLAACMMIFFWVTDELNYDTAGANADRVYRVALTLQAKGQPDKKFALTAAPLAPVLVKDFPQIEKAVRFEPYAALIGFKIEHFFADKFLFADSTFFDVFGFPMLGAKVENIMDKYYGKENKAMGFTGLHFLQPLRSIHLHSDLMDKLLKRPGRWVL